MILILGGTSESKEIAQLCSRYGYPVIYTTTTSVIDDLPDDTKRWVGNLDLPSFLIIVKECDVSLIVDATHPFAIDISKLAMNVSSMTGIPYLRFERSSIHETGLSESVVKYVNGIKEAADYCDKNPGIIFSAIGVKNLPELVNYIGERECDLVVRILPVMSSIKTCELLNIHPSRIIAMQGPFTFEIDSALIQRFNAKMMISKESGDRGGLDAKLKACRENDCALVIIKRPVVVYPRVCKTIPECLQMINGYTVNSRTGAGV